MERRRPGIQCEVARLVIVCMVWAEVSANSWRGDSEAAGLPALLPSTAPSAPHIQGRAAATSRGDDSWMPAHWRADIFRDRQSHSNAARSITRTSDLGAHSVPMAPSFHAELNTASRAVEQEHDAKKEKVVDLHAQGWPALSDHGNKRQSFDGKSARNVRRGWDQQLVDAGDKRNHLKHRYGLFGPSVVMEMRSEMLSLDPSIDEYTSSRQVFDQIGLLAMLGALVWALLVLWDTGGFGTCSGALNEIKARLSNKSPARGTDDLSLALHSTQEQLRMLQQQFKAAPSPALEDTIRALEQDKADLQRQLRALQQQLAAREPSRAAFQYSSAEPSRTVDTKEQNASRSVPGMFSIFSMGHDNRPTAAAYMKDDIHDNGPTATAHPAQSTGLPLLPGLGLEVPWEPTPNLYFILGFFCQLPLMVALCCYTFFAEFFAGAGADGLSYFPVFLSFAQLLTSAAVSTVMRDWNWMFKAVLGLLIAVPAILIVPYLAYPNAGLLSLFSMSLGIGLSAGLSTVLLAMALASGSNAQQEERELRGLSARSGRSGGGTSETSFDDPASKDNSHVTALVSGQSTSAIFVVVLWMYVKASGQEGMFVKASGQHYVESSAAVLNGGRLAMILAAAGCIFGAYVCTRVCAGRYDNSALTSTDDVASIELIKVLQPYALALVLNSFASTVLYPRLLDSAPSKYGIRPDWLASDLTFLYSISDLAGRVYSYDLFVFIRGESSVRDWERAQGQRTMIWVAIARGVAISAFILFSILIGWQDDSLLIVYVCLTGLTNGVFSLGFMQCGDRKSKAHGWHGQGSSVGLHLIAASTFACSEALGCLLGFVATVSIWV